MLRRFCSIVSRLDVRLHGREQAPVRCGAYLEGAVQHFVHLGQLHKGRFDTL